MGLSGMSTGPCMISDALQEGLIVLVAVVNPTPERRAALQHSTGVAVHSDGFGCGAPPTTGQMCRV